MSIAEKLIEELRQREDLRVALAEELLPVLASNKRLRLAMATSILREVATKDDLKSLRDELRKEIDGLKARIDDLNQRVARLEGSMNLFIKLFIVFNLPILIGIIGILLKMVFASP